MKEFILQEYENKKDILDSFGHIINNFLSELLNERKIVVHQISGRTKDFESLSSKIDYKEGKYSSLYEITDIVGLRIISYLESDIDKIAEVITSEFLIDSINSSDKRIQEVSSFGYKSLHLVASLNNQITNLAEYADYAGIKFEVQIRSILQHAWAEIEHDLGYKNKSAVPDQYKRSFNRLAALLETADIEFDRLKKELTEYEQAVGKYIKMDPSNVRIDKASLKSFNIENTILKEIRDYIAKTNQCKYISYSHDFNGIPERFILFKIITIEDLENSLQRDKKMFFEFIKEYTKQHASETYSISIIIYYYQHFLAAKTESIEDVIEYLNYGEIKIYNTGSIPEKFIDIYQRIKNLS